MTTLKTALLLGSTFMVQLIFFINPTLAATLDYNQSAQFASDDGPSDFDHILNPAPHGGRTPASVSGSARVEIGGSVDVTGTLSAKLDECSNLKSSERQLCRKLAMAKFYGGGEIDCVECFMESEPKEPSGWDKAGTVISAVAGPLAYLGSNALWSWQYGKSQNAWANAYSDGFAACNTRFDSYLNYVTSNGMNPVSPDKAKELMACNNGSIGGYAGFGGMMGSGYGGGMGNPFLGAGYTPGFLSGMMGPYMMGSMMPGMGGMGGYPGMGMGMNGMGLGLGLNLGMGGYPGMGTGMGGYPGMGMNGMGGYPGMGMGMGMGGYPGMGMGGYPGMGMNGMGGYPGMGMNGMGGYPGMGMGGNLGVGLGIPGLGGINLGLGGGVGGYPGMGGLGGMSGMGSYPGLSGSLGYPGLGMMGGGLGYPGMGGQFGSGMGAGLGTLPGNNGMGSYWNMSGGWNNPYATMQGAMEQQQAINSRLQVNAMAGNLASGQLAGDYQQAGMNFYNSLGSGSAGYGNGYGMYGSAPYSMGNLGLQLGYGGGNGGYGGFGGYGGYGNLGGGLGIGIGFSGRLGI